MDNAATSFPKPVAVMEAMVRYATDLGASAGRGAYAAAVETGALIAETRHRLNRLFNGQNPDHFVFGLNCSEALNLAIKGLIDPAKPCHAICSQIDHNSILRPMNALAEQGLITQTRVCVDSGGLVDPDEIRKAICPGTRFIVVTHASNVTGTVQPIREIGRIAREHDILFIVDAAQSAGHIPIDVQADHIDLLAAPGHKALLGPLGTGFLYIRPGLERSLRPLKEGGTGSVSEEATQPDFMPDKFEAGSHNAIGLIGLGEGVQYILDRGIESLAAHDVELVKTFMEGTGDVPGLTVYGPRAAKHRVGVFSVRIDGLEPNELSAILETNYGILTRSGIHCAPLAHAAIGTLDRGGTTRFSFGPFLSAQDVNYATDCLAEIAIKMREGVATRSL